MTQSKSETREPLGPPEVEDIKTLGDLVEACRAPGKRRQIADRIGLSEADIEAVLSLIYPKFDSDLVREVVGVLEAAGVGVKTID